MLDKKIKIAFKEPDGVVLDRGILVKPYLSRDDQEVLLSIYMASYFEESNISHVLNAEYVLLVGIMELCTNVLVSEEGKDGKSYPSFQLNELLGDFSLVKSIRGAISNYGEFRALLKSTVEEEKEKRRLEGSLGKILSGFSDTALGFMDKISSLDLSDENLSNIRNTVGGLESSPIITELLKSLRKNEAKE